MPLELQTKAATAAVENQQVSAETAQKVEQVATSAVAIHQSMESLGGNVDAFEVIVSSGAVKELSANERDLFHRVFGEMLSNVSSAFSAAAVVARLSPPMPVVKPLVDGQLFVSELPEDIKGRMESAIDDMFGASKGEINGGINSGWSTRAPYHYAMLGLEPAAVRAKVKIKLDKHFAFCAKKGLTPSADFGRVLTDELLVTEPKADAATFNEKYGLERVATQMNAAGMWPGYDSSLGTYTMADAYRLAVRQGLEQDAYRALSNTVRRCGFAEAVRAVEETGGGDVPMLNIGAVALQQYLRDGCHNTAWDAVVALKRVQGDLKPTASAMLTDLARVLFATGESSDRDLAFRAMRATGTLIDKKEEDSVKTDFITVVTADAERNEIIAMARASIAEDPWDSRAAIQALEACAAYDVIGEIGRAMIAAIQESDAWRYQRAAETLARGFDAGGLDQLATKAAGDAGLATGDGWSSLDEVNNDIARAREAVGRGPKTPTVNQEAFAKPDRIKGFVDGQRELEARLHRDLEAAAARSPAERQALRRTAEGSMVSGDTWKAFGTFVEAGDRSGLVRACDAMLEAGNGLNAINGLLAAAMLES